VKTVLNISEFKFVFLLISRSQVVSFDVLLFLLASRHLVIVMIPPVCGRLGDKPFGRQTIRRHWWNSWATSWATNEDNDETQQQRVLYYAPPLLGEAL